MEPYIMVTLDDEGMFWEIGKCAPDFSAMYISDFQSRQPNNCWLWKYKFGEYLLQTFPVYNELMTIYIPQEKQEN